MGSMLTPIAGFSVKTHKTAAGAYERGGKVFVNICGCDVVERAQGTTGLKVDDDHLDNRGLTNLQIPLLVGPPRAMEDSSGNPATAVDVVYHPSLVARALKGTPQHPARHFVGYLLDLALKNVEEDLSVKIERDLSKVKILPNCRYKGSPGQNANNTYSFEVFSREQAAPEPPKDPSKPKIQVVGEMPAKPKANKPAKPIIRKGFFDRPNKFAEDEELYPEGSAEGIPEPGRGNSVNMLPEHIKNKCHIVDTGAMDSSSLLETMKLYADTGSVNIEQKGVYKQGVGPKCDKPEIGTGHPDYYKKKAEEDAKWNPQKEKKEAPAAPVSDDLFKFVGQLEEPTYRIEDTAAKGAEALAVIVQLPKIERMSQLHLDVLEDSLQVRGGSYRLKVALPKKIDVNGVSAKFITKKKELKIVAPIVYETVKK